jgi:hypothetical protein
MLRRVDAKDQMCKPTVPASPLPPFTSPVIPLPQRGSKSRQFPPLLPAAVETKLYDCQHEY